jgi:hypothetical protein
MRSDKANVSRRLTDSQRSATVSGKSADEDDEDAGADRGTVAS